MSVLTALLCTSSCTSEENENNPSPPISTTRSFDFGQSKVDQNLMNEFYVRIKATESIVKNVLNYTSVDSVASMEALEVICTKEYNQYVQTHEKESNNLMNPTLHNPILYQIPEKFSEMIMNAYVNEDYDVFEKECTEVMAFLENETKLSSSDLEILHTELYALAQYRDMVLNIMVEYCPNKTRMSPGDRMIWQNCIRGMSHEELMFFIKVNIFGLCLGLEPSVIGLVGGLLTMW